MLDSVRRPSRKRVVVIFDAVGTLIRPVPDVIDVYHRAGRAFGSRLSVEEVKTRFHRARQKHFLVDVDTDQRYDSELFSSDPMERELWRRLVQDMFPGVVESAALLDHLWDHFKRPENWQVYDDVPSCWAKLRREGCRIGIGSNFDSRLLEVCAHFAPINTADWVFCSAAIGFRKPDLGFYRRVQNAILGSASGAESPGFWMVGDNWKNDVVAASDFGWESSWLVRRGAADERSISSLSQLPSLLRENRPRRC